MGILSKEEYDEKMDKAKRKVDYYDEIRKIKMQKTLGVITKSEYDEKIKRVLTRKKQEDIIEDLDKE